MPESEVQELAALCEHLVDTFGDEAVYLGMGGSPAPIVPYLRAVRKLESFAIPLSIKEFSGEMTPEQLGEMERMLEGETGMSMETLKARKVVVMDVTAGGGSIAAGVAALRALGLEAVGFSIRDAAVPESKTAYHDLLGKGQLKEYPPKEADAEGNRFLGNLIAGVYKQYRSVGVFKPQRGDSYSGYRESEEDLPPGAARSRKRARELKEFFGGEHRKPEGINRADYNEGFGGPLTDHKIEEDRIANDRIARITASSLDDQRGGLEEVPLERETQVVRRGGARRRGSKCFLTSACTAARGLGDDCSELVLLRAYRDHYLRHTDFGPAWIEEYYRIAPPLVEAISARPDAAHIWERIYRDIQGCVGLIRSGQLEDTAIAYRAIVERLLGQIPVGSGSPEIPLRSA